MAVGNSVADVANLQQEFHKHTIGHIWSGETKQLQLIGALYSYSCLPGTAESREGSLLIILDS